MWQKANFYTDKFLRLIRLKPVSVAGKCRLQFGLAIVLILAIALLIPYFWMDKLAGQKNPLDTGTAIADLVLEKHFQLDSTSAPGKPLLNQFGSIKKDEPHSVQWVRLTEDDKAQLETLTERQRKAIEILKSDETLPAYTWKETDGGFIRHKFVRLERARANCLECHSPEGSAKPFNRNQVIGATLVSTVDHETSRTVLMNRVCVIIAGLLAGTGAIIAFYVIAQRIILSPIRQLRALVNNIAEGNLDARSAIRTEDEYEKLSEAFNSMLDGLQESQEKLRQANRQLDKKIIELSDRNVELYKANKLKSEFLANMSHEFRTPLNAILGFADILKEKPAEDAAKAKRYAENIIKSGRSLLNMINDLLDLAKAEAGKMKVHLEKTSIPELCRHLSVFFSNLAEKKHIDLSMEVAEDIPLLTTDPGKVQQILYNFLSNAIKFTPEYGRIVISAFLADEKTVRISISDSGCGIAEHLQASIFDKFRQGDGSLTRNGDGTGLGLAISKELATLIAANISLASQPGNGATFSLNLPVVSSLDDTMAGETNSIK